MSSRLRVVLWVALAVVVWNGVYDRVLVNATRAYVITATAAAEGSGPYARIEDVMRPARSRALVLASLAAGVVVVVGLLVFRRPGPTTSAESPRRT